MLSDCGKKGTGSLTINMGPANVTLLNGVSASNCTDRAANATTLSAKASVGLFRSLSFTWDRSDRDLKIYAIRFTAKSATGLTGAYDQTLTLTDLNSLLIGLADYKTCSFCTIHATTAAIPKRTITIEDGTIYTDENGTATTATGCGPVLGGFSINVNNTSDVTFPLKATVLAFSIDPNGEVFNEYATATVNVKVQAPPQ
jgi:hypothetical protein